MQILWLPEYELRLWLPNRRGSQLCQRRPQRDLRRQRGKRRPNQLLLRPCRCLYVQARAWKRLGRLPIPPVLLPVLVDNDMHFSPPSDCLYFNGTGGGPDTLYRVPGLFYMRKKSVSSCKQSFNVLS